MYVDDVAQLGDVRDEAGEVGGVGRERDDDSVAGDRRRVARTGRLNLSASIVRTGSPSQCSQGYRVGEDVRDRARNLGARPLFAASDPLGRVASHLLHRDGQPVSGNHEVVSARASGCVAVVPVRTSSRSPMFLRTIGSGSGRWVLIV